MKELGVETLYGWTINEWKIVLGVFKTDLSLLNNEGELINPKEKPDSLYDFLKIRKYYIKNYNIPPLELLQSYLNSNFALEIDNDWVYYLEYLFLQQANAQVISTTSNKYTLYGNSKSEEKTETILEEKQQITRKIKINNLEEKQQITRKIKINNAENKS